jgi:CCR4-NOT transcription complex subunit 3
MPMFYSSTLLSKLPVDTLFYIFYHQQGSQQQLLAAIELKKKLWMYNTKYLTWFHLVGEAASNTEKGITGTFKYFDYSNNWTFRRKENFEFEYALMDGSFGSK